MKLTLTSRQINTLAETLRAHQGSTGDTEVTLKFCTKGDHGPGLYAWLTGRADAGVVPLFDVAGNRGLPTGDAHATPALACVVEQISAEVGRATHKFPTWPTDPLHAVVVLGEEFGELTKAMLQLTYEPEKTSAQEVRTEAVQTAAMAVRLILSLDRYVYRPSAQHAQGALESAA